MTQSLDSNAAAAPSPTTSSSSSPSSSSSSSSSPIALPSKPLTAELLSSPIRLRGKVVHGFQRGSKQLGFPTANLDPRAFTSVLPLELPRGVYAGWAQVDDSPVYAASLSLGLNPQFETREETIEAYILHSFPHDFYGRELTLIIHAFIRPSYAFASLKELIEWIENDVQVTKRLGEEEASKALQNDAFFHPVDPQSSHTHPLASALKSSEMVNEMNANASAAADSASLPLRSSV